MKRTGVTVEGKDGRRRSKKGEVQERREKTDGMKGRSTGWRLSWKFEGGGH